MQSCNKKYIVIIKKQNVITLKNYEVQNSIVLQWHYCLWLVWVLSNMCKCWNLNWMTEQLLIATQIYNVIRCKRTIPSYISNVVRCKWTTHSYISNMVGCKRTIPSYISNVVQCKWTAHSYISNMVGCKRKSESLSWNESLVERKWG